MNRALAAIDAHTRDGALSAPAADRLDTHVRHNDTPEGLDARYLAAVGSPAYERAFHWVLRDPVTATARMEADELEAMREVARVEGLRAALVGGAPTGSYALPFTLDPSIILSSAGVVNPVRQLARVITISTREWKGLSSTGVISTFEPELTEAGDRTPTFDQPTIETQMARSYIEASSELFDDWASITTEMGRLFADSKAVLEADKFVNGDGTDEPDGILNGLAAGQTCVTAGATLDIVDLYGAKEKVPNRFKSRASWLLAEGSIDFAWQLVAVGDEQNAMVMASYGSELLGRPLYECNDLPTCKSAPATTEVGVLGDFASGFTIADRLGGTVELIPNVIGPARNMPTGSRGLFYRWRVGSVVTNPTALVKLAMKP